MCFGGYLFSKSYSSTNTVNCLHQTYVFSSSCFLSVACPPLHIHHLQELLKASVYVCVWVQVCICVCACISPMQLQGLGHHAPEIWWTSAIKGRKTCDRYAAKNTLPPSFFVPPFSVGFVSELYLLMLNYKSDFFFPHNLIYLFKHANENNNNVFFWLKQPYLTTLWIHKNRIYAIYTKQWPIIVEN